MKLPQRLFCRNISGNYKLKIEDGLKEEILKSLLKNFRGSAVELLKLLDIAKDMRDINFRSERLKNERFLGCRIEDNILP